MQNKWYKVLAAALCALMLLTLAPTAAEGVEQHPIEALSVTEQKTNAQPAAESKTVSGSPSPNVETESDEPLNIGENTFEISQLCEFVYRPFTPTEDGTYLFYSVSDCRTFVQLYQYDDEIADIGWYLDSDDGSGEGGNFELSYSLDAGIKYILRVSYLNPSDVGPMTVMIEKLPENACGDHLTWTFDEASCTLTIDGYGRLWDYAYRQWGAYKRKIVSVSLPDGLIRIGRYAFDGCTALESVEIPDGVKSVGYCGFGDCSSLETVTLPISLKKIENSAFYKCPALTDVYYRGTEAQKEKMSIGKYDNNDLINAEWHYLGLPCPHKNACDSTIDDDYSYEELEDNLWHKENFSRTYCVYCPDCEQVLSTGETVQLSCMERHCYTEEGVCLDCGHVNTCEHRNLYTWIEWGKGGVVYTDTGDDRVHQASGDYCEYSNCRDCGWFYSEQKSGTLTEPHYYGEEGDCMDCGHKDACEHPEILIKYEWDKMEYTDYDDEYHLTNGWLCAIGYCPICWFDQFGSDYSYEAKPEAHDYDPFGYCRMCGHKGEGTAVEGAIEWNAEDVGFKGTTAYVVANGMAQTPRFTVKNKADGSVIDPANYDFEYRENINAGTGYVIVTFKGAFYGTCRGVFKIYLPATTTTTVENVSNGIRLAWTAVEGAAGYVIYRRAWSSTTDGWTDFVRWNNTTALNWTDTNVYAGTRYQYGVKAYFARRTDPVTGAQIGGNVGDNYNLGEVGPLKTTVRITTRTLNSVTAGTKQMTVKWAGSSVFTGYQIQYATNAAFTQNAKAVKITNPKTVQTVIRSLTSGRTYYVRVRSYHVFGGMTYFGGWSNVKSCKVK